jgi:peptide/nickel transport system substrate-binding protein
MANRRLSFRVKSAALSMAVALAACGSGPEAASLAEEVPEGDRYGGIAIVGITADPQSMNSLVSTDDTSTQIQQYMLFLTLLRPDESLVPQPRLAERWEVEEIAPDTLEATFHLRRDIRWHDGVPTTAEDLRFTYERVRDPRTASPSRADLDHWHSIEVVDSFTVRFRLRPHADYLAFWGTQTLMPAHILGDVPPQELGRHPFGTSTPVGNGPFRFVRRAPNQEWVFEAHPDFPEALGGRPYVDRVVFRIIPEQTTLLTELLTGRVDVYPGPPPAQAAQIGNARGVQLLESPHRAYTYIGYNTRLPIFADARVRRALSMAIDRQAIVDAILYGYGDVGVSTSTAAHWSYEVQKPLALPHDPGAARRLLRDAGWEDRDGDGVVENADGVPLRFTLVTNQGNDMRRDVGEIVQAQLRAVGAAVEPRTLEWNTLVAMLDGSLNERGERERGFQAVTSGWVASFRRDDAPLFHSRHLNDPYHETGFTDPRLDLLIDTLAVLTDRGLARPLWEEYHRILIHESPYTVLYYTRRLLGHRDRLRGVAIDIRADLVSVQDWWIVPEARR